MRGPDVVDASVRTVVVDPRAGYAVGRVGRVQVDGRPVDGPREGLAEVPAVGRTGSGGAPGDGRDGGQAGGASDATVRWPRGVSLPITRSAVRVPFAAWSGPSRSHRRWCRAPATPIGAGRRGDREIARVRAGDRRAPRGRRRRCRSRPGGRCCAASPHRTPLEPRSMDTGATVMSWYPAASLVASLAEERGRAGLAMLLERDGKRRHECRPRRVRAPWITNRPVVALQPRPWP